MNSSSKRPFTALEYADYLHSLGLSHWRPVPKSREEAESMIREFLKKHPHVSEKVSGEQIKKGADLFYKYFQSPSERDTADPRIKHMVSFVRDTLSHSDRKLALNIPVVDIIQPSLNAYAIKTPSGDRIISFNFGAGLALNRFNLSLDNILLKPNDKVVRDKEINYIFSWCLYLVTQEAYFLKGQPTGRVELDEVKRRNEERILELQIQFILAHEFYHHIYGHLDTNMTTNVYFGFGSDLEIDYYTPEQMCEFEADNKAFAYMQQYWSSTQYGPIYLFLIEGAIDRFLSLAALIEDMLENLRKNSKLLGLPPDHPPAKTRRERIRQMSSALGFPVQQASVITEQLVEEISCRSEELIGEIKGFKGGWTELAHWIEYKRLFGF